MARKVELLLELTECGMSLLWVRRRWFNRSPQLKVDYAWLSVSQGQSWEVVLKDYLLRERVHAAKRLSIPTSVLLPMTKAFVREFQVPPFSRQKLRQIVKYLIDEEVPLPKNDLIYDFGECSIGRVVIGAVRRSQLAYIIDVLHQLGLNVVSVDFTALRIASLLSLGPDDTAFFFELSEQTINFGVFRGHTPEIFRSFPLNSDRWESELWAQVLYYLQDPSMEIKKIVTVGHGTQDWAKSLLSHTQVKDWQEFTREEVFHAYLYRNRLKASQNRVKVPPLNLMRDFAAQKTLAFTQKIAASLTVLGVVLGLALSWHAYRYVKELEDDITLLEKEIEHVHRDDDAERNQWLEWNAIRRNAPQLGREMTTLLRCISPEIEVERIEFSGLSLYFVGSASRGSEVQELMVKLKQAGWENIALLHFSQQQNEKIRFTLSSER